MNIYLGTDHGGFEYKEQLKPWLSDQGYVVTDCGAHQLEPEDDYPEFAFQVANRVAQDTNSRGILLCRSGAGMAIAANKVAGIRAVDVVDQKSVVLAREKNDANIISLAGDWMKLEEIKKIISLFLETRFSQAKRHVHRIAQITEFEQQHCFPKGTE